MGSYGPVQERPPDLPSFLLANQRTVSFSWARDRTRSIKSGVDGSPITSTPDLKEEPLDPAGEGLGARQKLGSALQPSRLIVQARVK
eukprot:1324678-Pyramimonas_sp.AAC.1